MGMFSQTEQQMEGVSSEHSEGSLHCWGSIKQRIDTADVSD